MTCQPAILAALHWQYPQAAVVALPAMAILSAYVLWAYLPQVRQVGRAWAWALPALRLSAFAALAVSLLRPAVTRPRTPAERGPVVFLIDDSRSMSVTDTGRSPGQRVAVAAALARLPAGARDSSAVSIENATEQLAPLTDAVARARAELAYARLAGRDADAATARLDGAVDALRLSAKAVSDAVAAAGAIGTPRLERQLGLLATAPAAVDRETWLDRAGDRARAAAIEAANARNDADGRLYDDDPTVHDAADAVARQSRERLAWFAVFDADAGLLPRLGLGIPTVAFTVGDHVAPIADQRLPPEPTGVTTDLAGGVRSVLDRLSATSTAEPPRAVVLLSDGRQVNGGSPESVAAVAAGVPVHTVAIASRSPSRNIALTGLTIPRYAYPGEPVVCHATVRSTALTGLGTDVTFAAGDDRQVRHVTFAGDRPVALAFTWTPRTPGQTHVSVRAGPIEDEATVADNVVDAWTAVVGSPVRVAPFSPTFGWSAALTCASLAAMPDVRLMAGGLSDAGQSDVVVLFDVTAKSLTPAQWDAVTRLATDRGGGVIVMPPDGGFGPGVSPSSPLGRLLPFAGPPPVWLAKPTGPFQPATDLLSLADTPAESARRWAALPPSDGHLPLTPLRPDTRTLLSADGVPVVVERSLGPGRVICLASGQSWRWRLGPAGARDFDRFWTALVREAAGDPYASESGGVSLDADAFETAPEKQIHIRLKLSDPASATAARLRVLGGGDGLIRTVPFRPKGGGRFDLLLTGLTTDDYTLEADVGEPPHPRVRLHVRPSADAELADLSGDENFLRRLSDATGGRSFRLDQLAAVAAQLAAAVPEGSRPIELPLWDGPYLYAGVLGLLTAEWALRRRAGLA